MDLHFVLSAMALYDQHSRISVWIRSDMLLRSSAEAFIFLDRKFQYFIQFFHCNDSVAAFFIIQVY